MRSQLHPVSYSPAHIPERKGLLEIIFCLEVESQFSALRSSLHVKVSLNLESR